GRLAQRTPTRGVWWTWAATSSNGAATGTGPTSAGRSPTTSAPSRPATGRDGTCAAGRGCERQNSPVRQPATATVPAAATPTTALVPRPGSGGQSKRLPPSRVGRVQQHQQRPRPQRRLQRPDP